MPATLTTTGYVARVQLSGDIDFSDQEELKTIFEQAVQSSSGIIEVDMEATTFIDSAFIRLLLRLLESATRSNKSLVIMNCNEHIAEIFSIGGFDRIFDIR